MSDAASWTRRVLEAEARKRGIRDPEARSRLELARLILRHDYTSTRGTRRMIGKLVGNAAAKLSTLGGERSPAVSPAEERRRQTARSFERRAAATANEVEVRPMPAAQSGTVPAAPDPTAAQGGADSATQPLPAAFPTLPAAAAFAAQPAAVSPSAAASEAVPFAVALPTLPAAAAFPTRPAAATSAAPPSAAAFPTQSIAAISPAQPAAATSAAPPSAAALPTLPAAAAFVPPPSAASEERLDLSRREPRVLHLSWRVSEQGADRARILLGMRGELALRIVSVRADADYVVHSEVTDHGPIESDGEWSAQLDCADTHCVGAIGLRSAGRFVSIVHCSSRPDAAASS